MACYCLPVRVLPLLAVLFGIASLAHAASVNVPPIPPLPSLPTDVLHDVPSWLPNPSNVFNRFNATAIGISVPEGKAIVDSFVSAIGTLVAGINNKLSSSAQAILNSGINVHSACAAFNNITSRFNATAVKQDLITVDIRARALSQMIFGGPDVLNGVSPQTRAQISSIVSRIEALGGHIISSSNRFAEIRANIPANVLNTLASMPEIIQVRCADLPYQVVTNGFHVPLPGGGGGINLPNVSIPPLPTPPNIDIPNVPTLPNLPKPSDLAHALQTNIINAVYNVTGIGVKICVISDDVNGLAELQRINLMPFVEIINGQDGLNLSSAGEGTAILQLIHEIAPNATLAFATGFAGPASMADNIFIFASSGCRIIVDDITYRDEPPFSDAYAITIAAARAVEQGIIYISSAGNAGNLPFNTTTVWEGVFNPSIYNSLINVFDAETQRIGIRISGGLPHSILLWWSDQLLNVTNDYNLFLITANGTIVASALGIQNGLQDPMEILEVAHLKFEDDLFIAVSKANEFVQDRFLRISLFGGSATLIGGTAGSIFGHAAAPGVLAAASTMLPNIVNATTEFVLDHASLVPDYFTSDGPRHIFYGLDNLPINNITNFIHNAEIRVPNIFVGFDGILTSLQAYSPFYGTSAAVSTLAGLAALTAEAALAENITVQQIIEVWSLTAIIIGNPELYANVSGNGLPNLPEFFDLVRNCSEGRYESTNVLICRPCPEHPPPVTLPGIAFRLPNTNNCVLFEFPAASSSVTTSATATAIESTTVAVPTMTPLPRV